MTSPTSSARKIGLLVLAAAVLVAAILWWTAPTPDRKPVTPRPPLVTVQVLEPVDHPLVLEVHGRVEPITSIEISPRVTGEVTSVHDNFVPGGRVKANETLVQIDPGEYLVAERIARAQLDIAKEELALEAGRQRAARAEWKQFGGRTEEPLQGDRQQERDLATRGPQLRIKEAEVARAEAALSRAQLDLHRCRIRLPQNVVLDSIQATRGTLARPGDRLAVAYPVGAFWVRGALPIEELRWIAIGVNGGASVWPRGAAEPLAGTVREVSPSVQERGSLGEVLVEVPLPAGESALPLRTGEFVRVTVAGETLEQVLVLPRSAVHGDDQIWLLSPEGRLLIQSVRPVVRSSDVVVVTDETLAGQRLITSQLAQPVAGMAVRVSGAEPNVEAPRETP